MRYWVGVHPASLTAHYEKHSALKCTPIAIEGRHANKEAKTHRSWSHSLTHRIWRLRASLLTAQFYTHDQLYTIILDPFYHPNRTQNLPHTLTYPSHPNLSLSP